MFSAYQCYLGCVSMTIGYIEENPGTQPFIFFHMLVCYTVVNTCKFIIPFRGKECRYQQYK